MSVKCVSRSLLISHIRATPKATRGTAQTPHLALFDTAPLCAASASKSMGNPGLPLHCVLKNVPYSFRSSKFLHFCGSSFLIWLMVFVAAQRQSASVIPHPEEPTAVMIVLTPHSGGPASCAVARLAAQLRATRKRILSVTLRRCRCWRISSYTVVVGNQVSLCTLVCCSVYACARTGATRARQRSSTGCRIIKETLRPPQSSKESPSSPDG